MLRPGIHNDLDALQRSVHSQRESFEKIKEKLGKRTASGRKSGGRSISAMNAK